MFDGWLRGALAILLTGFAAGSAAAQTAPGAGGHATRAGPADRTEVHSRDVDGRAAATPVIGNAQPRAGAARQAGTVSGDSAASSAEGDRPAPEDAATTTQAEAATSGASDGGQPRPDRGAGTATEPSAEQETADAPQGGGRETAPVAQPLGEPADDSNDPRPDNMTVTVATWDSAFHAAQQRALFAPFASETGHKVETRFHDGDMAGLTSARVRAEGWDLVQLPAEAAQKGCREGWLTEIDSADLPASVEGDPAETDYLPGALLPCAAGSAAWSAVTVFDSRTEFDEAPDGVADLFDLVRFPGMRALPRQAPYTLELALLADGVPPERVYDTLATPAGQDRAFAKLSAVRHAIVWWDDAAAALEPFADRAPESLEDVVMGVAFNGRVFTGMVRSRPALRILWDGQIYQFTYWAVPRNAPNRTAAMKLLRFASMPERQARQTRWFPYGPVRRSALPLVGRHAQIEFDMADFVPTMPRHMTRALRFDRGWWHEHGASLKARFADWLALPAPQVPPDQLVPPRPVRASRAQSTTIR
ncbi:MAG: extracellular solute-binding protein [Dichotomicrobium sp.]